MAQSARYVSSNVANQYPNVSTPIDGARHHCIDPKLEARCAHPLADCGQSPCRGRKYWNRRVQPRGGIETSTLGASSRSLTPRRQQPLQSLEDANGRLLSRLSRWQYAIGIRDVAKLTGAPADVALAASVSAGNYHQHVSIPTTYGHVEAVTGMNRGDVKEALIDLEATGWGVVVAHGVRGRKDKPTRIDLTCPAEDFEAVRQAKRVDDKRRRHAGTPKSFVPVLAVPQGVSTNPDAVEMETLGEESAELQLNDIRPQQATLRPPNRQLGERTAPGDGMRVLKTETVRPDEDAMCHCAFCRMLNAEGVAKPCQFDWNTMSAADRKEYPYLRPMPRIKSTPPVRVARCDNCGGRLPDCLCKPDVIEDAALESIMSSAPTVHTATLAEMLGR